MRNMIDGSENNLYYHYAGILTFAAQATHTAAVVEDHGDYKGTSKSTMMQHSLIHQMEDPTLKPQMPKSPYLPDGVIKDVIWINPHLEPSTDLQSHGPI